MVFQGTKNELLRQVEREIILKVNNREKAISVLKGTFSVFQNEPDKISVKINDDLEFNLLLKTMIGNGIEIYDIESQSANLEQIFINLISKKP